MTERENVVNKMRIQFTFKYFICFLLYVSAIVFEANISLLNQEKELSEQMTNSLSSIIFNSSKEDSSFYNNISIEMVRINRRLNSAHGYLFLKTNTSLFTFHPPRHQFYGAPCATPLRS